MGMGREVADAYISVHGDLSPFRQKLEDANKSMREAAIKNADTFDEAWSKRMGNNLTRSWDRIIDGLYSGDQLDINRMITRFDPTDLDNASAKIHTILNDMRDGGKLTDEQWRNTIRTIDDSTRAMQRQGALEADLAKDRTMWAQAHQRMMADFQAATKQAKLDQDKFNKSFEGMLKNAQKMDLEQRFRGLSNAMGTLDFSGLARGARNMDDLRERTINTATEMRNLGRMTDEQFQGVQDRLALVAADMDAHNVRFRAANRESARHARDWSLIQRMIGNAGKKFAGFSGLNVLTDVFRDGAEFFQNLDRNAVNIAKMGTLIGTAASSVIHAVGGLAVMGQDLAAIGNLGILAPGFLTAMGIGVTVLVAALKDMGTVLGDLGPQFSALQDSISAEFWAQAEQPIRNLVENLFPTLQAQLAITATGMGALVGAFAAAFQGAATPERVTGMFEKMNSAITILAGAMEPLVQAFVTLGEVGSQYFERFAQWIVDISTGFNNFIQQAAGDGRLNAWIETAITNLQAVGSIIGSLVGIWNAIGDAAKNAGIGGLIPFAAALDGIVKVMGSPMFSTALTQLFTGAASASREVGQAIQDIGPAIASFMPTLSGALITIGHVASTVVGYIGEILANPAFQAGITAVVAGATTAINALGPAITPMANSLGQVGELLGQVLGIVGELVAALAISLSPVLDVITAAFGRITFAAGPEIVGIIEQLGAVLGPVINTLLPPLEGLIMSVLPLLGAAFKAVSPIIGALASFIAPVIGAIKQLVDMIMPSLIPALEKISAAVTPVIEVLGAVVQFILSILVPILGFLLIGIINNVVGVFEGLSNFIMGFVQIVTSIFTGFGQFFTKLFQGDIGGALTALGDMFKGIWDGIVQMLGGALEFLWNAVQLLFIGKLIGGIKSGLTAIGTFFRSTWDDIVRFFTNIWTNMGTINTIALNNIKTFITNSLTAIKNFFSTIFTNIWNFVKGIFDTMGSGISNAWNATKNFLMNAVTAIFNFYKSGFTNIWNTVKSVFTNMGSTISGAMNSIKSYISNAIETAKAIFSIGWNAMLNSVRNIGGNILNFVRGIPGQITSALGNLGGLLSGAGRAIIDGLLNGLKASWGAVTSFVGGIADWIANNKGPLPYDRRLLIPAGNAIMEGLGRGLEDKLGMLKGVLNNVTDTMTDTVTEAFAKSKMYVAGADAALGLADGLKSNKSAVANALSAVLPDASSTLKLAAPGRPGGSETGAVAAGTIINIEAGAIPVTTPTENPELVASKVIDGFANYSNS